MNRRLTWSGIVPGLGLVLALAALALAPDPDAKNARDPDVGRSFRVPYRLTATNHFLVRIRVNGKGPFNFLIDTGAPAVFIATDAARKAGLKSSAAQFWTPVDRLDIEGGATLRGLQARVEDPYQLVGMNALGLPGAAIDGLLGFSALARFKIELDPTHDRMTWTRLDFEPKDPPAPRRRPGDKPAAEMQAMNALGAISKLAAILVGKQPEDVLVPRGFLGLELEAGANAGEVRVARVLPDSPASKAGVQEGDRLVRVRGHEIASMKDARAAVAETLPGDVVALAIRRAGDEKDLPLNVTAGEGF
jgi:serine protease Do